MDTQTQLENPLGDGDEQQHEAWPTRQTPTVNIPSTIGPVVSSARAKLSDDFGPVRTKALRNSKAPAPPTSLPVDVRGQVFPLRVEDEKGGLRGGEICGHPVSFAVQRHQRRLPREKIEGVVCGGGVRAEERYKRLVV